MFWNRIMKIGKSKQKRNEPNSKNDSKLQRIDPDNDEESKFEIPGMKTRSRTLKEHTIKDVSSKRKCNEPIKDQKQSLEQHVQIEIVTERPKSVLKRSKRLKMPRVATNALMPTLYKLQLVWAYIKGYPRWPGVIEDFMPNGKYLIHFFGDYTRAEVTRRNIINYFDGFNEFACNFGNIRLRKAVEVAKYFLFGNDNTNQCFVCEILEFKRQLNPKTNT